MFAGKYLNSIIKIIFNNYKGEVHHHKGRG